MKSLLYLLAVIAGLLAQFQWVAIGNEVKAGPAQVQSALGQATAGREDPAVSAEDEALQEVETAVRNNPANAPQLTEQAIKSDVPHPVPRACEIVRATIAGLGNQATNVLVARIVYAAVTSDPAETLSIESVAIEETPASFHQDIVTATIAAVPDPYECVEPARITEPCQNVEPGKAVATPGRGALNLTGQSNADPDGKSVVGKGVVEGKQPITPQPCYGPTMAEAIYQEALLSGATEADFLFNPYLGYTGDYGVTGIANDELINKQPPPTPPPTPTPVSP